MTFEAISTDAEKASTISFDNLILCKSLPPPTCYLCHVFHIFGIAVKIKETCYHSLKVIISIDIHYPLTA